jgi:RNA polymerase sigma-70 factor (ECF subfamily)
MNSADALLGVGMLVCWPEWPVEAVVMVNERWNDADLSRKCRQQDPHAWRELLRKYSPVVYRVTVRMLGYGAEADDATQEAFMRVHRSFDSFDPTRPLKPWLSRITYNVCLRRLGKADRKVTDTTDPQDFGWMEDHKPNPEDQVASEESGQMLLSALDRLSAQDRVLFDMHYREGMSLAEVSEVTQIPVNTIKTRMHRSRGRLKRMLSPLLKRSVP